MAVQIKNLCKAFGSKKVLNNLNLTLEDGGIYCLMGPSGMGKTTLLRIMMNLESMDSGEITGIESGKDISAMFQEDRILMMLNAVDNVNMMYKKKRSVRELKEDLKIILPEKCLNQPVCELSGGMKRRVSLARTMHYPGQLIILDEPFTGLDKATKKEVISYILKNRRNRILLVATHGEEDAALLGAEIIHLEECQSKTVKKEIEEKKTEKNRNHTSAWKRKSPQTGDQIRIMDRIPDEDWEQVVRMLNGRTRVYEKGEILWRVGEYCRELPVILEGAVATYTVDAQQTSSLVSQFEAGHCFGEMLVLRGSKSPVNVKAVERTRIMYLSSDIFTEMDYSTRDGVRAILLWNLMQEMAGKMEILSGKLQTISEPTLRSKLISYIRNLPEDEQGRKQMTQTQKEMALYLHVHPVSVSKELTSMEDERLIRRSADGIELLCRESFYE